MVKRYRRGGYVPLAARYYQDDKIMQVGPMAELLYVRSLAFSASSMQDGFIYHSQIPTLSRHVRGMCRACASLVSSGLWIEDAHRGGYQIAAWLQWNRTADDVSAARARDNARKKPRPQARIPRGIRSDSRAPIPTDSSALCSSEVPNPFGVGSVLPAGARPPASPGGAAGPRQPIETNGSLSIEARKALGDQLREAQQRAAGRGARRRPPGPTLDAPANAPQVAEEGRNP